jgi:hypothetical protein
MKKPVLLSILAVVVAPTFISSAQPNVQVRITNLALLPFVGGEIPVRFEVLNAGTTDFLFADGSPSRLAFELQVEDDHG